MDRAGKAMQRPTYPLESKIDLQIEAALTQLRTAGSFDSGLVAVIDVAIGMTGADMGTPQRFNESDDCLVIVASRGFSSKSLNFFGIVRRDTNTTRAAAFTRRMRVFVEDVATSYLFVGTRELDILTADGIAAAQSTPLISSNGRLWGILTTHFRQPQMEIAFNHAPLDRLAVQIADTLEQRDNLKVVPHSSARSDGRD